MGEDIENEDLPPTDATPEIHVDEDWKAQVEQEPDEADFSEMKIPPASFAVLISTLATQAMASLGIFPDPITGQPNTNRTLAKHFIDTLSVLEEKTKNNLTDDEATQLRDSLHQLRMIYLQMPNTPAKSDLADAKPTSQKSTIELP